MIVTLHTMHGKHALGMTSRQKKCYERHFLENCFCCKTFEQGKKKHMDLFNINCLHTTQNPPFWPPVPHFLGKNAKRDTHRLFRGDYGVTRGFHTGRFWATKSLVHCFFPSLLGVRQRSGGGVMRRNGRPRGRFWRVRFFSAPLRL